MSEISTKAHNLGLILQEPESLPDFDNHEAVVYAQERPASGLQGYIAIHNTNLGRQMADALFGMKTNSTLCETRCASPKPCLTNARWRIFHMAEEKQLSWRRLP